MNIRLIFQLIASFLISYSLIEILKRKLTIHPEISRKALHMVSGLLAIFWSMHLSLKEFIICLILFLIFFSINNRLKMLKSLEITSRKTYGEFTYVLGLLCLALVLYDREQYFILGSLILIFPDTVGGLVNHYMGKSKKEIFHLFSYLVVTCFITSLFLPIQIALVSSLILTGVEFISGYGFDNFTVPLIYSLIVLLFL